jgi:hypothetical protein
VEKSRWFVHGAALLMVLSLVLLSEAWLSAQSTPSPATGKGPSAVTVFSPTNEVELASAREQLFKLLRMSPKLTSVVARDPSLLGDQEYVSRNNPELSRFLQNHPEIARNPEFYLFGNLPGGANRDVQFLLQRAVWPEIGGSNSSRLENTLIPFLVFLIILVAILWLMRVFLENRRWGRLFKVQTDIHNKLLDKLGGSQELLTYMGTEAGRRFLELAPIPVAMEAGRRLLSPIARILTPLQLGIVSTLVSIGLLYLRSSFQDSAPLLLIGTVGLMLGIGFILSAGVSWALARHLGLMAPISAEKAEAGAGLGFKDRQ